MNYQGGKAFIAKRLSEVINKKARRASCYIEPFLGGASVFSLVDNPIKIGADNREALITMWDALINQGWEPPDKITEADYQEIRNAADNDDPITAFVAAGCSYGGKWWGGYARNPQTDYNHALGSQRSLLRKRELLREHDCFFVAKDYLDLVIPKYSCLYLDPPYEGTTGYGKDFDHDEFWEWVGYIDQSCSVFISELSAPEGYDLVWRANYKGGINGKDIDRVEKLFYRGQA